jgi:hypothetical protein
MFDGLLKFGHGIISLNGVDMPGIMKSQAIKGSVRFDSAEPDGHSGTVRTPLGWEDSDITLVVELISGEQTTPYTGSESCYEKLARINRIFKGKDNGTNPNVYEVENPHANARDIHQVVFSGLQSTETDQDDVIQVNINFVEHLPFEQVPEKQVATADKAFAGDNNPHEQNPDPDESIMVDVS